MDTSTNKLVPEGYVLVRERMVDDVKYIEARMPCGHFREWPEDQGPTVSPCLHCRLEESSQPSPADREQEIRDLFKSKTIRADFRVWRGLEDALALLERLDTDLETAARNFLVQIDLRRAAEAECDRLTAELEQAQQERDDALSRLDSRWATYAGRLDDRIAQRVAALENALRTALRLAEGMFGMIDPDTWRDTGGDDGQGHYEGDYRAAKVQEELAQLRAALAASGQEVMGAYVMVASIRPDICDSCGRKSWVTRAEEPCQMPQPDGRRCQGTFVAASERKPEASNTPASGLQEEK